MTKDVHTVYMLLKLWPVLGWVWDYQTHLADHHSFSCWPYDWPGCVNRRRHTWEADGKKWLPTCSRHIWEWGRPGGSPEALLWTPPDDKNDNFDNLLDNENYDNYSISRNLRFNRPQLLVGGTLGLFEFVLNNKRVPMTKQQWKYLVLFQLRYVAIQSNPKKDTVLCKVGRTRLWGQNERICFEKWTTFNTGA